MQEKSSLFFLTYYVSMRAFKGGRVGMMIDSLAR